MRNIIHSSKILRKSCKIQVNEGIQFQSKMYTIVEKKLKDYENKL